MKRLLQAFIRAYQLSLSPFLGSQCRFTPSCSLYAAEAIDQHGPMRGCWLALRRIIRCQPLCAGGYDPVPRRPDDSRHAFTQKQEQKKP